MTDIATISALPIGAFFREGWLPLAYRDGKPILVVNGVEHDVEGIERRTELALEAACRAWLAWTGEDRVLPPSACEGPMRDAIRAYLAALQEPRHDL